MESISTLLEPAIEIARQAGERIREIYEEGQFQEITKSDNTPVTTADLAAHDLIVSALTQLAPEIPILSEEDADIPLADRQNWHRYWLIDPLDGTQEFIAGSGDFAVNIALVENHRPILGVVYAPISRACYFAVDGKGAFKRMDGRDSPIHSREASEAEQEMVIAVSRRQRLDAVTQLLEPGRNYRFIPFGSASLKSCMVAEGEADLYLRLGPTGEWDTGASQCIVEQAGGRILDIELNPLSYNERESLENPNYLVLGAPALPWHQILQNPQ
ncbi:3'(2'),5'-bisphosphate nucleotidase CysQ [Ferrimonas sp. YFM]|uniref:3'(2'),5'-bisphosphate nucleotidase CysQ n=1 Tax=Ferrimonas sp. YFM TaxID=3028878 RepID=UPI0025735B6B|nr:3'(2'),5'-bisphosphate nucleotidase CysQ [Ferrimonas sp. YFM]BDY03163.1 3'(2'),5'-bisphosphate nucleotidase CysQ [Ferrimonas sp. YFM]